MANVEILISTTLQDLNGNKTPQQVYADAVDTVTLAQLVTAVNAHRTPLGLLTDAPLLESTGRISPIDGGKLKIVPAPKAIILNALSTYPHNRQTKPASSN